MKRVTASVNGQVIAVDISDDTELMLNRVAEESGVHPQTLLRKIFEPILTTEHRHPTKEDIILFFLSSNQG